MQRLCFVQPLFVFTLCTCFLLLVPTPTVFAGNYFFNAKDFGATGNWTTKDTQAIQSAIDAAHEMGGGTVVLPAGTYLSGTLLLRDNITLQLEPGCTLLGSTDQEDFPCIDPALPTYTRRYVCQALIYGEGLKNIAIIGRGTIDGQGTQFNHLPFRKRPYLIRLVQCKNIRVRDITLVNSPMWVQHYLACDDLVISGIHVNSFEGVNNDGCDIDACRNVRISDSYIHSSDDALVLKSTTDRSCENVTITNCVLSSYSQGFKLGTESNGGFRNITMSNCTIRKPGYDEEDWGRAPRGVAAIGLLMIDGGVLERVNISDITVRGMNALLFVRVRNRARPYSADAPKPGVGITRDVHISNILARDMGPRGSDITGLPGHPVENVSISNIDLFMEGGEKAFPPDSVIKEVVEGDPAILLDHATKMHLMLPAFGFYCRHVSGLQIEDVKVYCEKADERPALIADDIVGLRVENFSGFSNSGKTVHMVFRDVRDSFIQRCVAPPGTKSFIQLEEGNARISVFGNHLVNAEVPFLYSEPDASDSIHAWENRTE